MLDSWWQDIRFAWRLMRKNPGFSAVIIACLALGIGPSTTAFSLINASLFQGVDAAAPEELVQLTKRRQGEEQTGRSISYPNYLDIRDRSKSLASVAVAGGAPLSIRAGDTTQTAFGSLVSSNYFDVLGRTPLLGTVFHGSDEAEGLRAVVVLGHGFWQEHLGSNRDVVGKLLRVNGHDYQVLGVMAPSFTGHTAVVQPAMWIPVNMAHLVRPREADLPQQRAHSWMRSVGRLRQGATLSELESELAGISQQLAEEDPRSNQFVTYGAVAHNGLDGGEEQGLMQIVLLAGVVVGVLLLLSCSSTAALYLARATTRRREIAIRMAVGAGRLRVVRQLLIESIVVALLAGLLALGMTLWAFELYKWFLPEGAASSVVVGSKLDLKVLAFTLGISLLTGVLFGLAPAWQTSRPDLLAPLRTQDSGGDPRGTRLRNMFVVAQFGLAVLLLICAGLFVKGLRHASTLDPGFESREMLIFQTDLSHYGYSVESGEQFMGQMLDRLAKVEGVKSVSASRFPPLSQASSQTRATPIGDDFTSREGVLVGVNDVSPRFFETLGIGLVEGREFVPEDDRNSKRVVVINETLAKTVWPNQSAVGQSMMFGPGESHEVVGVARDSKYWSLGEQDVAFVYFPIAQAAPREIALCIRTQKDPEPMLATISRELTALNPDLAVANLRTISEHTYRALLPARIVAILFGVLGGLALLLSVIGVYGVVSYSVTRRRLEIGIRLALGGQPRDLVLLLVRQGLRLVIIGAALGIVVGLGTTGLLAPLLNGINPIDWQIYTMVPLLLLSVAWLAIYIPARRATEVDPMVVLRYE